MTTLFGNLFPPTAPDPAAPCTYKLATVIMEIALRAGMDPRYIDVGRLAEIPVRGFALTNAYPAIEGIRELAQVYYFDPSNYDSRIHFIPRGDETVATVTEDEMLDDDQDIEQTKRADSIQIPRVLHLNYQDINGGLAPDKQTSERAGDRRATGEISLQTAVVMNGREAAIAVIISHKVMIENQKGELKFSLPDKYLKLVPANNIFVQWQGRTERVRIIRCDVFDGYQEYTCLRDRQSAYGLSNLAIQPFPTAPQTPPPSSVVGPTLVVPLDIHILRDADDQLGLYVAISGILEAWRGALVELSYDGGANYIDQQEVSLSAVMGELLTELGPHSQYVPDFHNTCSVRIDTPNGDLFESTFEGMLNRFNLAAVGTPESGWELINFQLAEETTEGEWTLARFLRGRKGSPARRHVVGERFVLLERGYISLQPAALTDIGRSITLRATSFGTDVSTGTVVTFVFTGRTQIEREVGYLRARRDGTDLIVDWQGIGRIGGGGAVAHGIRFDGYRVRFSDGGAPVVVDTDDQGITQNVSGLSSPSTVSGCQVSSLTGEGPSVEVIVA